MMCIPGVSVWARWVVVAVVVVVVVVMAVKVMLMFDN